MGKQTCKCHVTSRIELLRHRKADCGYLRDRRKGKYDVCLNVRTYVRTYRVQLNTRVGERPTWPRFVKRTSERERERQRVKVRKREELRTREFEFYVTLIFVEFHRGRKLKRETCLRGANPPARRKAIPGEIARTQARLASFPSSFIVATLSIQKYKLRKFHPSTTG